MWTPASDQHAETVRIARAARDGAERRVQLEAEHEAAMERLRLAQQHAKNFTCAARRD